MNKKSKLNQDTLFVKLLFKASHEVTNDEVDYYRKYRDQIEQVTLQSIFIKSSYGLDHC